LAPQQRVEVSVADAERLGLKPGDEVRVAQNDNSVIAAVDVKERIAEGTVFLIEGTKDANANALLNGGGPVEVSVETVGE
jgi:anaerobic selenocysteine-containing dehydrogenase